MDFWIFMFITNLLIPAIMIIFGYVFIRHSPRQINMVYGYRTSMSMKNKDTWMFAHKYCGRLWFIIGCALTIPSIIAMLFLLNRDTEVIGIYGLLVCIIQTIFLIIPIIPTERALKKIFDENGNRK